MFNVITLYFRVCKNTKYFIKKKNIAQKIFLLYKTRLFLWCDFKKINSYKTLS
jgi:hypothetical protein